MPQLNAKPRKRNQRVLEYQLGLAYAFHLPFDSTSVRREILW